MLEFTLGCITHRLVQKRIWPVLGNRAIVTAICFAPIVVLALPQPLSTDWQQAAVAVGFAISIGIIAAQETLLDNALNSRPLQFLGIISYSIYLNHEILYSFARSAADTWWGRSRALHDLSTSGALALFAVYIAILIAVSWATWRWIEEPLRVWFKRIARSGQRIESLPLADASKPK